MKKEINELLQNGGKLKLNEYCVLDRWFKDAIGNDVDMLSLRVDIGLGTISSSFAIESRSYDGIMQEVAERMKEWFTAAGEHFAKAFLNGYLG